MIQVSNLSKIFSTTSEYAVQDVSFKVHKAEIVCIIGASGCGKTTVLKMINGLEVPSSGDVWLDGKNLKAYDPVEWRRKLGYVVQKGGLLPHITVYDNISLLSRVLKKSHKSIKERVKYLMDIVSMPYDDFSDRYPHELSGGQQQKIGIIRALMEDPKVICMDEPFSALDPLSVRKLHEEFSLLNQKLNKTILFVSHDLHEAFDLADRIILMREGRVEQIGVKRDFIDKPKTEYVQKFIESFRNGK